MTLGSQHVCTIARVSAECVAHGRLKSGDTENGMSCALGFLATCTEIQQKEHGLGTYWALGAVDLECKHPSARIAGLRSLRIAGREIWRGAFKVP
jgi:hypothetical protein